MIGSFVMTMRFQKSWNSRAVNTIVCKAMQTLNKWTKKSANLGAYMALFGTPSWAYQPVHSLPTLLVDFHCRCLNHTCPAFQTEEENPFLCSTSLWAAKRLNADMADTQGTWPTETSMIRCLMTGQCQGTSSNMYCRKLRSLNPTCCH